MADENRDAKKPESHVADDATRKQSTQDETMKRLSDDQVPNDQMSDDTGAATEGANGETAQNPLEMELAKAKKDYLYLYAEFENYKKNAIKERADLRKFGPERLVVDLLNVLDIFDTALAIEQTPENMASIRKGFEMTALELKNTLERHGVQEMPGLGAPFDPNTHEALSSEETAEFPEGHVARVFKKPYRLHERLVRPGQVVVAKGKN